MTAVFCFRRRSLFSITFKNQLLSSFSFFGGQTLILTVPSFANNEDLSAADCPGYQPAVFIMAQGKVFVLQGKTFFMYCHQPLLLHLTKPNCSWQPGSGVEPRPFDFYWFPLHLQLLFTQSGFFNCRACRTSLSPVACCWKWNPRSAKPINVKYIC